MPIIRGKHSFDGHFTQIPNAWLRDARLSFKARGILAELLSHSPGFSVSRDRLARSSREGKDAISAGLQELEKFGYLRREQQRNGDGTLAGTIWTTQDPTTDENPRSAPWTDYPATAKPPTANPHTKNTEDKNTESKKITTTADAMVTGAFMEFWDAYPRKVGKLEAERAFRKLWADNGDAMVAGARRLAADPNLPWEKRFIPHPATWLNRAGWEDEPYPPRERTPEELAAIARQRAEQDRARREEQRRLEQLQREQEAREREANPVPRCEHDRIVYNCRVCGPAARAELEATRPDDGQAPNAT